MKWADSKRKHTWAEWDGDHLVIHWFGIKADEYDTGAQWHGDRLIFEGLSEGKGWKLGEKPTAEHAMKLISAWQNGG